MGLIGGPLLIAASIAIFFGAPSTALIVVAPVAVWEFSLGVYLVVKGFKPCAITAAMTEEATPPVTSVTV